jgi:hypothetical protein
VLLFLSTNEIWIASELSLSDRHFVHDAFTGREIAKIPQPSFQGHLTNGMVSFLMTNMLMLLLFTQIQVFQQERLLYDPISKASLTGVLTLTSSN